MTSNILSAMPEVAPSSVKTRWDSAFSTQSVSKTALIRHSRAGGNPGFSRLPWPSAFAGVTTGITYWTRSQDSVRSFR